MLASSTLPSWPRAARCKTRPTALPTSTRRKRRPILVARANLTEDRARYCDEEGHHGGGEPPISSNPPGIESISLGINLSFPHLP